jgi:hypothetical protein
MQFPGASAAGKRVRALLACALAGLLMGGAARAGEAPAVTWASYIAGDTDSISTPKVEAFAADDPEAGFYLYSAGDRPLIAFDGAGQIIWETRRERGVNDVDVVNAAAALTNGRVLVAAYSSQGSEAQIFGQPVAEASQYLAILNRKTGAAISVLPVTGGRVTALAGFSEEDYFVAGIGSDAVRVGLLEIEIGAAPAVFLARVQAGVVTWTLLGQASAGASINSHGIQSIRLFRHHDNLFDIYLGGSAPGPWEFGGARMEADGVYQILVHEEGEVMDARVVAAGGAFRGLEVPPLGNGAAYMAWEDLASGESKIGLLAMEGFWVWQASVPGTLAGISARSRVYGVGTDKASGDTFVTGYDLSGQNLWRRQERGRSVSEGVGVALLKDGRLAFSGKTRPAGIFLDDWFLGDLPSVDLRVYDGFAATVNPAFDALPVLRRNPRAYTNALPGETIVVSADVWNPNREGAQWLKDGEAASGQTEAALTIPAARKSHAGNYLLTVGATASESIAIDVREPVLRTIAGTGASGFVNDLNPLRAQFHWPRSPALVAGAILVADSGNHAIRRLDAAAGLATFAGTGEEGFAEGAPLLAQFSSPMAIALRRYSGLDATLLVADRGNGFIRNGALNPQTLAPQMFRPLRLPTFSLPSAVAATEGLEWFVFAESGQPRLWKADGLTATRVAGEATFGEISAVALDARGNIYVADSGRHVIERIDLEGRVTRLAGTEGVAGFRDGFDALLNTPSGLALDAGGRVYFTERGNHAVRRINDGGYVVTLAGLGRAGLEDGGRERALLNAPEGLCFQDGSIIVADTGNHVLRKIVFEPVIDAPIVEARLRAKVGAGLVLSVTGGAGDKFALESTPSLAPNMTWTDEGVTLNANESTTINRPSNTRFYRARKIN